MENRNYMGGSDSRTKGNETVSPDGRNKGSEMGSSDSRNNGNGELEEVTMQVSGICRKDGNKFAYVTFSDGKRHAEGTIPDCRIITQEGFEEAEIGQLELFMKMNLAALKRKAASIDPVRAMMKSDKPRETGKKPEK